MTNIAFLSDFTEVLSSSPASKFKEKLISMQDLAEKQKAQPHFTIELFIKTKNYRQKN